MATEAELKAARRDDEIANREIGARAGRNGLQCVVDEKAFMHAVETEGREILTSEGRPYWRDMKRMYPHLRGGRPWGETSPNMGRNHYGKVTLRQRNGRWERRGRNGDWVPEDGSGQLAVGGKT